MSKTTGLQFPHTPLPIKINRLNSYNREFNFAWPTGLRLFHAALCGDIIQDLSLEKLEQDRTFQPYKNEFMLRTWIIKILRSDTDAQFLLIILG